MFPEGHVRRKYCRPGSGQNAGLQQSRRQSCRLERGPQVLAEQHMTVSSPLVMYRGFGGTLGLFPVPEGAYARPDEALSGYIV
jgi:hypothetical protein